MTRFFLSLCCAVITCSSVAQTSLLTRRLANTLSPAEQRCDDQTAEMDLRMLRRFYINPASHSIEPTDSLCRTVPYRSAIYAMGSHGHTSGDFLPYEGNGASDIRIAGIGEYTLRSAGTIFGTAQYSRGRHQHIGWSATRSPQLYLPYLSTDSVGGDFRFEDYHISGGYAFQWDRWHLGCQVSFSGEQAWRKTDPRALNNTTWLRASLGAARRFGDHLLMWQAGYGRNKQHLSLRYWRPGQQDRFFVTYGFGLYDFRKSGVFFGYSRMYYIDELTAGIDYRSPQNRPLVLRLGVHLRYDDMQAEETNIQDLYQSHTTRLTPYLRLDWQSSSPVALSLSVEADLQHRKGYENIFEEYLVDETNNIYDFRRIDTQQNYTLDTNEILAQLRLRYRPNTTHTFGITGGTSVRLREERYAGENYLIRNNGIFPHLQLDYRLNQRHFECELGLLYGRQLRLNDTYQVTMRNQSIEHLDFQHAFSTYAYYNSTFTTVALSAACTWHLGSYGIGAAVRLMVTDGRRDPDTAYTGHIGFSSSAPILSPTPDRHDERWLSSALYFVF